MIIDNTDYIFRQLGIATLGRCCKAPEYGISYE